MSELLTAMKSEWMVTATVFVLLVIRLGKGLPNGVLLLVTQFLLLATIVVSVPGNEATSLFGGMFRTGPLIGFQKAVLTTAVYLITLLFPDWFRKTEHLTEFLVLMLCSLLGMFLMLSSGSLLMFYLSLELGTIPVAALANFDLERKRSAEGAMKLILSSAFSSGILLFGISLVYGTTGSIDFVKISQSLDGSPLQTLAFMLLFGAFAFKLSVVPFHLWTADVYEGSPMPVTAYLSVVSKGAIAFVFIGILYRTFGKMQETWYLLLFATSVATLLIGNLFAVRQDNIKRFLAFSSIAQVGFMLVAISGASQSSVGAVTFFVLVYVFSNLAAFGVASVIAEQKGVETIDGYRGLAKREPMPAWVMALALFSLAGVPPVAGFFGKWFLLGAGANSGNHALILFAALNMIVSLFYYLRWVRAMFMDPSPAGAEGGLSIDPPLRFGLMLCAAAIVFLGLFSWIYEYVRQLS
jgi:NADH-quinone oxidoreductase subunit N